MWKPLGCKDISVRVCEGEIFFLLFIQYDPVHWLYYVEGKFFGGKKKCISSGQKANADTMPVLKKIHDVNEHIMSDVLPGYFFSDVKGVVNMARFQLMHVQYF